MLAPEVRSAPQRPPCIQANAPESLSIRLDGRRYALDLSQVLAVSHGSAAAERHSMQDQQQQCSVPVLDLRGMRESAVSPSASPPHGVLILVEVDMRRLALLVDAVNGVPDAAPCRTHRLHELRAVQTLDLRRLLGLTSAAATQHFDLP